MKNFILYCACAFGLAFSASPTDLDSLFKGHEYQLVLNDSLRSDSNGNRWAASSVKNGKEYYTLQFDAIADFDEAQRRRGELSAATGLTIRLQFDAPFYRLQGGNWPSKAAAEDKSHELAGSGVSSLVVKVK